MSEMYKIEKGVPLPDKCRSTRKYPLREMAIGDSFLIPGAADKQKSLVGSIHSCAAVLGKKIASRREGSDLRIWRIA